MTEFTDVLLAAYQEQANWARHYDTIRIGITALLVTLSGATVTAVWALTGKQFQQNTMCCTMIIIGLLLTGLSVQYDVEYRSSRVAEKKMQGLAIKYLTGNKVKETDICQIVIWKKQAQAYYEALDIKPPEAVSKLGCEDKKWPEGHVRFDYQDIPKLKIALRSTWFWLNFAIGVGVPFALFWIRPRPKF